MGVILRIGQGPRHGGAPLDTRIRRAVRHCLAEEIERLLAILDGLDVDPDLEPGGDDEPALGWTHSKYSGAHVAGPNRDDREEDDEREQDAGDEGEMDEDREWSLGSLENVDQAGWSMGAGGDLEDERL